MNELVKVEISESNEQIVSVRDLHRGLGIEKHFTQWWIQQVKRLKLREGIDFLTCRLESTGGRPAVDFHVKLDTAKHICMMSGGQKAHEIREYFIEIERAWNSPDQIMARALSIANQKMLGYAETIKQLEVKIEVDKPKVIFADAVAASKSSILVGEMAKLLRQNGIDIGQNRLFEWFRENGYLSRKKGEMWNLPTQKSMDMGLFKIKKSIVNNPDGSSRTNRTPKVTGKGQQYFIDKFIESEADHVRVNERRTS